MKLPVEDDFNDVIGKAQKGLGINTEDLAQSSGVAEESIRKLRRGELEDEAELEKLGRNLDLNVPALMQIARNEWYPKQPNAIDGFALVCSEFYDRHVNAFVAWDPMTMSAAIFDTGTTADPIIELVEDLGLKPDSLFITHAHGDHIAGVDALLDRYGCSLYVPEGEGSFSNAILVKEGSRFEIDGICIEALSTPGHTVNGMSYFVSGLSTPVGIVGDALFAGSMGGAQVSYEDGLRGLSKLMAWPEATVLGAGHGPLTTVAEERAMNCFCMKG